MTKPYKCRVEYLEADGNQYIDTGYKANNTTKVEIKTQGQTWTFGGRTSLAVGDAIGVCFNANTVALQFDGQSVNYNQTGIGQQVSECVISKDGAYINGVLRASFTEETFTSTRNLYLFNLNNDGSLNLGLTGKMWYCRIYDNGTLVFDFIPVLDNSGRPAMYDQVSGQLFYNQGSGDDFSYGRQIIPVEYLYTGDDINCGSSSPFTSTSYRLIDTKETIDLTSVVEIKFAFDKNIYYSGCGLRNSTSSTAQSIYFPAAYSTENKIGWTIGSGEEQRQKFTLDTNDHTIRVDLPNSNVVWDNVNYPIENLTYTPSSRTFPLFAFSDVRATQENGYRFPIQGKIYYAKFWKNGVLTRDFIPAVDENNIGFMFDKVNNTVYLNEGTGQFKVGPNVEKVWSGKKLRKKLALALANLKKPRKYYCEVEYLESTGTQIIKTGIPFIAQDDYVIKATAMNFDITKRSIIISNYKNYQTYSALSLEWWAGSSNNGKARAYCSTNNTSGFNASSDSALSVNTVHNLEIDYSRTNGKLTLTYDGTSKQDDLAAASANNSPDGFCLFLDERSSTSSLQNPTRIYYLQIYHSGTLVRDLIPVLDWNMTPCMFDRVTEQLFYNAGSGNGFSYGREIHYVDYLESTGTQYINTGLLSTASSTVDTAFSFTSMESGAANNVGVFGGRNGTTSNTFTFFKIASATPQYFRFDYNGQPQVATASDMTWNTSSKYRFQYNGTNCITTNTTTGESTVLTRSPGSTFTQYPIYLFAVNTAGTIGQNLSGRIYYYKYSDGTNSVDMVPAIDENGVGYMLDRVSHTIYDNAGTGAFNYPAREVEYLQSDGARAIGTGITIDDTCGFDIKWMALNSDDKIIMGTKGSGDSRWVLSGSNNPNVNISWNTSLGSNGLGLNQIQTAKMNYLNDRKRILNDIPLADITTTLSANASTYNVGIFAGYWGSGTVSLYSTCRIYYAKITKGTEFIRDFVPMIKDGSPCLFDKIGGLYYFGAGTGTFTTGKIVEPEYE